MLQTLITGFGPFLSVTNNPSQRLAAHAAHEPVPGHHITSRVLPVSYREAPRLIAETMAEARDKGYPFDVILMLGVASNRPHWSIERFGRNRSSTTSADAEGQRWRYNSIVGDGPALLPVTLPVQPLVEAIAGAGLPAIASESAGDYLCNHLLYKTLHQLQLAPGAMRAGFVPIPADRETFAEEPAGASAFTFEEHCAALRAVLEAIAALAGGES